MSRRVLLATSIVVLWVGVVGWHVQREYFVPELTRLAEATLTLSPETHYYSLRMGGDAIGTGSSQLDTLPDGFRIQDLMILGVEAMGQAGDVVVRTEVSLSRTLRMRDFLFQLQAEAGTFRAEGTVEGDTLLRVRVEAAGADPEELTFAVSEPPIFSAALPLLVAKSGELRVGRTVRVPVFDPSTLSNRPVDVEIMEFSTVSIIDSATWEPARERWIPGPEREIAAWRIQERFGGITTESWIDQDGRMLRASSPMGFTLERTSFELARQDRDDRAGTASAGGDIIFNTAIASNRTLDDLEGTDRLRFRLTGTELDRFDLEGARQSLRGDTLEVRREALGGLEPGFTLPYAGDDLHEALAAEPLIQSGDPRIIGAAESMLGREPAGMDPVAAAVRLNEGVYELLAKEITFSLPSAVQALEDRRGDCMEHTTLYLALARSVGLPARAAVGLVYLDGRFFYHAWPEVWLGEWVAMDPTFGQAPADAAHLRFIHGSLARQVEVASLIGSLGIEVLDGGN
ncbi:MAG: transglutaminase domain-containing protein [Gemmatimonadales bacterium]|nr:MAG: transglutaminase domain-containing protein [Gemmatimonadales bacterium]